MEFFVAFFPDLVGGIRVSNYIYDFRLGMGKERRDRSVSAERCRTSPYPSSSSSEGQWSAKIYAESEENLKEWEDAKCPVCMEHPHNAVLLICSSHEKGCRPYMCDTSYRHSNCLDQFCKSFAGTSPVPAHQETDPSASQNSSAVPALQENDLAATQNSSAGASGGSAGLQEMRGEDIAVQNLSCENKVQQKLVCPLCRGQIQDWVVVEPARCLMNTKPRSCSCETCNFSGNYSDLRKHARIEHPLARPSETDPARQRNWRRLERQRDIGDLLSTLQSLEEDRNGDSILPLDEGGWLSIYFLVRVFRPRASSRSSSWSGTLRSRGEHGVRRRATRHWGESNDDETESSSREEDSESSDGDSGPWRRRVRRRTSPDNRP